MTTYRFRAVNVVHMCDVIGALPGLPLNKRRTTPEKKNSKAVEKKIQEIS